MKIDFYLPPGEKSLGGLEQAVLLLQQHMQAAGVEVRRNPDWKESAADLIHFHGLWQPRWMAQANCLRREQKPYVVSPHGMLEPWAMNHKGWKKWPYYHLIEKKFLSNSNCLIATGRMEAEHIAELLPDSRIESIPLGLTSDKREEYQAARSRLNFGEKRMLLFLSRVHPKKGLDLLLSALVKIRDSRFSDCRLVVVGDGDPAYVSKLKAYCDAHVKELPSVTWTGEIWGDGKWDYLRGADLFCLPSHSENFGMAVLESLQVGTPILTTDNTPWAEYAGRAGCHICKPELDSVAQGLREWMNEVKWPDFQRSRLAEEIHERFNWDGLIPQYLDLYKTLLTR